MKIKIVLFVLLIALTGNVNADMIEKSVKFCTAKWPVNYSMREYCQKRQAKSINNILDFATVNKKGTIGYRILARCFKKWKPNYNMTMYCTKRQHAAYKRIKK